MVPDRLGERQRLREVGLGLPRKPDDHIGRQGDVRQEVADLSDQIQIALAAVASPHGRQHAGRARLDRQMKMPADLRQPRHRLEEPIGDVPRVRAGKSDALDARHVMNRLEQAAEVAIGVVRRAVVVDDLTEQLYLAPPRGSRFADFRENVRLRTHPFVSSRVRHDAETAEFVAAFDDRDVGLDRVAATRHTERERDVVGEG